MVSDDARVWGATDDDGDGCEVWVRADHVLVSAYGSTAECEHNVVLTYEQARELARCILDRVGGGDE